MAFSDEASRRHARFRLFSEMADLVPEHPAYNEISAHFRHLEANNPDFKHETKKGLQRASHLAAANMRNGPSLYADKYVRSFLLEYNGRILKGRGNEQPASFNIMRSFITPDDTAFILSLLEERFFQFNLLDYLEFITSQDNGQIGANDFEELKIYELNSAGSFAEITLPGFNDLVFCGAAFVREGQELSMMGVFTSRDPEDRAGDLSKTSGQPDALIVIMSWKVMEPRRIEQEIHRMLAKERINSRREFFKAKFELLREAIEAVIKRMNAQVS